MIVERLNGYRYNKAIVGFGGKPTLWFMRFFKKGFYHCIVALGNETEWIIIDPLLHFTDLIVVKEGNVRLFLKKHGYRILETELKEPKKIRLRVFPYTCVETAKRFLGIEKSFIFTPFQLFSYLNKKNRKKILDICLDL